MATIELLKIPSTLDLLADMAFWQTKTAQMMGVQLAMLGKPDRPMTATEVRSLQATFDQKHGIRRPIPTPATKVPPEKPLDPMPPMTEKDREIQTACSHPETLLLKWMLRPMTKPSP